MQFFGWGHDRYLAAETYDAINVNTQASGRWSKKPPDFPTWPRPNTKTPETEKPKATVKALWQRFNRKGA